jgi:transcription elongation factor Elf1
MGVITSTDPLDLKGDKKKEPQETIGRFPKILSCEECGAVASHMVQKTSGLKIPLCGSCTNNSRKQPDFVAAEKIFKAKRPKK